MWALLEICEMMSLESALSQVFANEKRNVWVGLK